MGKESLKIALVGNPNSGKSTIFNQLTGLRQSVSNFPGVTVDKKEGVFTHEGRQFNVIDLPGIYSLFPNSSDEKLVVDILTHKQGKHYPDLIVYVADATNLERHLLLATQIADLKIPMIFALNMVDLVDKENVQVDTEALEQFLEIPVLPVSGRKGINIEGIKAKAAEFNAGKSDEFIRSQPIYKIPSNFQAALLGDNPYFEKILLHHHKWLPHLTQAEKNRYALIQDKLGFSDLKNQVDETMTRYEDFGRVIAKTIKPADGVETFTEKVDKIITHKVLGPFIFFAILFFMFQAVFAWAGYPMDLIEGLFNWSGEHVRNIIPQPWLASLLVDGVIAGIGGVMVFIPQIAILFLLIAILEETGYMARVVYMFDEIMQKFGLNGRSIVALVSSGACAIPAIMSTRTISDWKERLNTILIAPLISCSARIPVYTILVGFVVPEGSTWGLNNQGLAFMGLYLLGIIAAFLTALVIKYLLRVDSNSHLMIELPVYKPINFKNALLTVKEKVTTFIVEAGKVIFVISIILWLLSSYGPSDAMMQAEIETRAYATQHNITPEEEENLLAAKKIEASYAGHIGKFIEPAIKPLGYDWKIGIALITSFAAREVFVGTMATIYSIGSSDNELTIRDRMAAEINPHTGEKTFNFATSLSLLVFYVFAMQCMSTLAVTKRETKSWKWAMVQLVYMSVLAYVGAFAVYQYFS